MLISYKQCRHPHIYMFVSILLVLNFLIKIQAGLKLGLDINDYNFSEFLINFEGGFVRRGLIGQILFYISCYTGWSPLYVVYALCISAWLTVVGFLFFLFKKRNIRWWILLSPLMLGMAVEIIRKDYLLYLIIFAMLYLTRTKDISNTRYFCCLFLIILGLLVHEALIFYGIPLVLLLIYKKSSRLKSVSAILITVGMFILISCFKGNHDSPIRIVESWNNLHIHGFPYLVLNKYNSIGALGWDILFTFKFHFITNFFNSYFGWFGFIYQPLTLLLSYYFIMNFSAVFSPKDKAERIRTTLSSVYAFNIICLLPMFIFLSCDYGRLYQFAFVTSYAIFLIVPYPMVLSLFHTKYIGIIQKFNIFLNRLLIPSKGILIVILLLFAVELWSFNPVGNLRNSILFTDYNWIFKILRTVYTHI